MNDKTQKIKVGEVGVDSGQVIICDPCYLKGFNLDEYDQDKIDEMKRTDKLY